MGVVVFGTAAVLLNLSDGAPLDLSHLRKQLFGQKALVAFRGNKRMIHISSPFV